MSLDPKTSKRIFELARDQQQELGLDDDSEDEMPSDEPSAFQQPRMDVVNEDDEDDDEDLEDNDEEIEEEFVRYPHNPIISQSHVGR